MLRLRASEKAEKFRSDFQAWLKVNSPENASVHSNNALDQFIDRGRKWQQKLAKGKWIAVHWPESYGGRGLSLVEEAIIQEELARINAPQILGLFGLTMVGPVLIKHGTEEQKTRFLPRILDASEVWSQGFSEPGAGSDLAAVKTRAQADGDKFILNGQKVWTSFAQIANWCFVLCRTSDEPKKHEGLSYILVDMKSPGITVRPLKQISGDEEFNEVFFDNVAVPSSNIVGKVGDGWKIAISTLMYERVVLTFARMLQSEVALRELIKNSAGKRDSKDNYDIACEIARACSVRSLAYEHLMSYSEGNSPGPEGSLDKLLWSESFQSVSKLALRILGSDAANNENDPVVGDTIHRYLYSRGRTIAAGTSEIQRNIIADRILGLPRQ